MRLTSFVIALFACSWAGSISAQENVYHPLPAQETDFSYRIIAEDGTHHRLTIRYTARLYKAEWQTGESSRLDRFRISDTRQCNYRLRFSHDRSVTASFDIATGAATNLQSDFITGPVADIPLAPSIDLTNYFIQNVGGPLINAAEEAERVSRIVDAMDWDLNSVDDIFRIPVQAAAGAVEFSFSGLRVAGNSIGRALGLRRMNCGEARHLIDGTVALARASQYPAARTLAQFEYSTAMWRAVQEEWAYFHFATGQFVSAYLVIPEIIDNGYEGLSELWVHALVDRIYPGAPVEVHEAVNALGSNPDPLEIVSVVMPLALADYEGRMDTALTEIEGDIEVLLSLVPPEEELVRRITTATLTFGPDTQDDPFAAFRDPGSNVVQFPSCIVLPDGRPGQFFQNMALTPGGDDSEARNLFSSIDSRLDRLGQEGRAIESAMAALMPEAEYPEVLDLVAARWVEQQDMISPIARFIQAENRCRGTVLWPGTNTLFPVDLVELDEEEFFEILRNADGVTDPGRPMELRIEANQLGDIRILDIAPEALEGALQELQQLQ